MNKSLTYLFGLMLLVAVGLFVYYYLNSKSISSTLNQANTQIAISQQAGGQPLPTNASTPTPQPVKIPFGYTIKAIEGDRVTLTTDRAKGDLVITKDFISKIYSPDNKEQDFSYLKAGQNVNIETIPGKSATIRVVQ